MLIYSLSTHLADLVCEIWPWLLINFFNYLIYLNVGTYLVAG